MRFQPIRPATAWALLAMESALALVVAVLLSTAWLVVLLPLGYMAAVASPRSRAGAGAGAPRPGPAQIMAPTAAPLLGGSAAAPSWLVGLVLSIVIWATANVQALTAGPVGPGRVLLWWMTGVLPVMVGLGLWWRGGVLARSEIGAQDVRTEFVILGGASLAALVLLRGLVNPPTLLIAIAGLVFVASGLLALSLARQDAAEAQRSGGARSLAGMSAAGPTAGGLVLAGVLTPALVAALWAAFGSLLQILLAPLVLLLQWLASLLPRFGPGAAGLPPGLFDRQPLGDLSELQRQAGPPPWLVWLILGVFALLAIGLVAVVIRVLLAWTGARRQPDRLPEDGDAPSEAVGSPRKDARALFGWLWGWLRRRLLGSPSSLREGRGRGEAADLGSDARAAYRSLLAWARSQGVTRRESETTQQFRRRLDRHVPDATATFELITDVYESDRYGHKPAPRDRLAAVRRHLDQLLNQTRSTT